MKTSNALLLAGAALAALLFVAHIARAKSGPTVAPELTGERVTKTYDLPALKHLDLEGPIRLILTAGLPSVTVEADASQIALLDDRDDVPDKLTLRLPRGRGDLREADMVVARVSSPALRRVEMSGRSELEGSAPLDYGYLDLDLSGGTVVDLAFTQIDSLYVDASGSLRGVLRGAGGLVEFRGSGSSDLDASGLRARQAVVSVSGSSAVRVHADSTLEVRGSGSTDVEYSGQPRLTTKLSGSSSVEAVDVLQ